MENEHTVIRIKHGQSLTILFEGTPQRCLIRWHNGFSSVSVMGQKQRDDGGVMLIDEMHWHSVLDNPNKEK